MCKCGCVFVCLFSPYHTHIPMYGRGRGGGVIVAPSYMCIYSLNKKSTKMHLGNGINAPIRRSRPTAYIHVWLWLPRIILLELNIYADGVGGGLVLWGMSCVMRLFSTPFLSTTRADSWGPWRLFAHKRISGREVAGFRFRFLCIFIDRCLLVFY